MDTERDKAFDRWFRLAELQLEFLQRWGVYKLNVARAELLAAVAAGQQAVAQIKRRVARELESALQRLQKNRRLYLRRADRWGRQSRQLALIRLGEDLSPRQWNQLWIAFRVFENRVPYSVLEPLFKQEVKPAARRSSEYTSIVSANVEVEEVPVDVRNVYQLIAWIKAVRVAPRRGTTAYQQVVAAFGQLSDFARLEIKRIEDLLKAIEQETLDAWKPVALAALPDSVDVQKIIQAGMR